MTKQIPQKIVNKFRRLVHNPATSGILLIISTIVALLWANLTTTDSYHHFWDHILIRIGEPDQLFYNVTIHHIVNDFLMAIFFFMTGLEIKREIKAGELSSLKKASVPVMAAVGGMLVPAVIFVYFNKDFSSVSGWGVPMATDIAFSLGILALLGKRVPLSLKIFLTALAIADDLGAVIVIAVFYTDSIVMNELIIAGAGIIVLLASNYFGIRNRTYYYVVGIFIVWTSFMYSGVHATIAGIMVAFTIPSTTRINTKTYLSKTRELVDELEHLQDKDKSGVISPEKMTILLRQRDLVYCAYNPLQYKERYWHPIVNFFIMPVFALANAGVVINGGLAELINHPIFLGIFFGLIIGKLIGVFFFTKLAQWLRLGILPKDISNMHILGVGLLAGIGFTMSLFVANLAFFEPKQIEMAKQAILATSLVAAVSGYLVLFFSKKKEISR